MQKLSTNSPIDQGLGELAWKTRWKVAVEKRNHDIMGGPERAPIACFTQHIQVLELVEFLSCRWVPIIDKII